MCGSVLGRSHARRAWCRDGLRERIVPLERIAEARGRGQGGGLLKIADPRTVERVSTTYLGKVVEAEGDDLAIEVGTDDTRVKVVRERPEDSDRQAADRAAKATR